jgi:hypothetical protein
LANGLHRPLVQADSWSGRCHLSPAEQACVETRGAGDAAAPVLETPHADRAFGFAELRSRHVEGELPEDVRARCHVYNSFFYKKATEKPADGARGSSGDRSASKIAHERVTKWTKAHSTLNSSPNSTLNPALNSTLDSASKVAHKRVTKWTKARPMIATSWSLVPGGCGPGWGGASNHLSHGT